MSGRRFRWALLAAVLCVGGVTPYAGAAPDPTARPQVVVALSDTGINPYHSMFYRPQNTRHPCTWVKGFTDCSIPALPLSVGKYRDYRQAVAADQALWRSVKQHQWYWIPRTNIIAASCDLDSKPVTAASPNTCILDDDDHGTGTASSVLTEAPDALLVVHDGSNLARDLKTAPVTADIQSHSWGPPAPLPLQVTDPVVPGCPLPFRRPESLFFIAAGNNAPFPTIPDCERNPSDVQIVGGGAPGYWDYDSWTLYDFASWMCRPIATFDSTTAVRQGCGTSFAAPTAAGAAAAALLRIRQHDHYLGRSTLTRVSTSVSRDQFVAALRNGATYSPRKKFKAPFDCINLPCLVNQSWSAPMPEQAPYLFWGYGWLDSTVTDAIVACALGGSCPAKSPESVTWNETRQRLRGAPATR